MASTELARFTCKYCGKGFDEGRQLGGHVRQAHQKALFAQSPVSGEGEMAARVLELWKEGTEPYNIVTSLRVHPNFVRGVLKEYDELLNEWKKSTEPEKPAAVTGEATINLKQAEREEKVT